MDVISLGGAGAPPLHHIVFCLYYTLLYMVYSAVSCSLGNIL